MLSRTTLSIILICCSFIQQIEVAAQPPIPPCQITNNYYNATHATASNSPVTSVSNNSATTATQQNSTSIEHTIHIKFPEIHLPTITYMTDNITAASTSIRSWLWNNKWNITGAVILYAYTTAFYQLYKINNMLQLTDTWCTWKEAIPMGSLVLTPSKDLIQQLQRDIYKKYYHAVDPQNTNAVHTLFLQETNLEMAQLDRYLALYDFYQTIHMQKFFPFKYLPTIIQERKARLQFVMDLFITRHLQD